MLRWPFAFKLTILYAKAMWRNLSLEDLLPPFMMNWTAFSLFIILLLLLLLIFFIDTNKPALLKQLKFIYRTKFLHRLNFLFGYIASKREANSNLLMGLMAAAKGPFPPLFPKPLQFSDWFLLSVIYFFFHLSPKSPWISPTEFYFLALVSTTFWFIYVIILSKNLKHSAWLYYFCIKCSQNESLFCVIMSVFWWNQKKKKKTSNFKPW